MRLKVVALNVRSNLPFQHPLAMKPLDSVEEGAIAMEEPTTNVDEWSDDKEIPYIRTLNRLLPADIRVLGKNIIEVKWFIFFRVGHRSRGILCSF